MHMRQSLTRRLRGEGFQQRRRGAGGLGVGCPGLSNQCPPVPAGAAELHPPLGCDENGMRNPSPAERRRRCAFLG